MNARLNIGLMRQMDFIKLLLRCRRHVYMLDAANRLPLAAQWLSL
jgi:hypothetical protein